MISTAGSTACEGNSTGFFSGAVCMFPKYNNVSGVSSMKKMTKRRVAVIGCILACAPFLFSLDSPTSTGLKLEPQPKELQLREGGFQVGPQTKIFVQLGHQAEDRIAAETLAEEVESQSGLQLNIFGMKAAGKAEDGAIVLARLEDERVRHFLARNGLKADSAVGSNGYLLFSDKDHLIVAANSGEGLFYGVQTLRQLLRPAGHGLMCPAVGIRDWPGSLKSASQSLSQLGNTSLQGGSQ